METLILHIKCKSIFFKTSCKILKRRAKPRTYGFSFSKLALNMWSWVSPWTLQSLSPPVKWGWTRQ